MNEARASGVVVVVTSRVHAYWDRVYADKHR